MKTKEHLIHKETTNILKCFAIVIVMVSHYYRYAEVTVISGIMGSIGFFGAALFAFLSGYGINAAYQKSKIDHVGQWIYRKLQRVYFPFLFVSAVSVLTIYKGAKGNIWQRIFLNTDDFVMWYVPYIIFFYICFGTVFYIVSKYGGTFQTGFLVLCIIGLLECLAGYCIDIGSQWYTSTGALLCGVYVSEVDGRKFVNEKIELFVWGGYCFSLCT